MRSHVIGAVFRRNVASYFAGMLGYLFILVFVVAGALAAFRPEFFAHNLANLDQLSAYFPLLLLFLVPAITMTVWSEERKLGTDELLFTLPATDVEILLGKYLAVLAVYTIALVFSLTHALVLKFLGAPDWGLIATTYLGYWLAGASLLAAGMFASSLTSSATVAFVVGALLCAVPVLMDLVPNLPDWLQRLTFGDQFRDFAMGIVPLSGLLYFTSLAVFMLYLNAVQLGRRHWFGEPEMSVLWTESLAGVVLVGALAAAQKLGWVASDASWLPGVWGALAVYGLYLAGRWLFRGGLSRHYAIRACALAAILVSLNFIVSSAAARVDMTKERLFTLSPTTDKVLDAVPKDRPVTIQAYISPTVPQDYQAVRTRLIGLLRQIDRRGGSNVQVRIVDVEPFSAQADEAAKWGIEARRVQWERGGRFFVDDIYMGAVITSLDEVVIPFFDLGSSVEYELTRSIGTVSEEKRPTVGVLTTDAKLTGGFDMQTFRSQPEWRIVAELKKQYKVQEVSADSPITGEGIDVLLAVLPSSLTEPQMQNFLEYVQSGKPVLIFDDPLPRVIMQAAPLLEKPRAGGGMMGMGGGMSEPKADGGRLTQLMSLLESAWERNPDRGREAAGKGFIVLDQYNPHPEFADVLGPEWLFITPKSGVETAINPKSEVTGGLQEVMAMFPGSIRPKANSDLEFTPLLRSSSRLSGLADWDQVTTEMPFFGGVTVRDNLRVRLDSD
jgi:ABC-2 type transport system permease protein